MDEVDGNNDDDEALGAFSPTLSMQHEVGWFQSNTRDVPMNNLMVCSTDSYDGEDQSIAEDLATARELYYLLNCENDLDPAPAESQAMAVCSTSTTPLFHIEPIHTNWRARSAYITTVNDGSASFSSSNAGQYRDSPHLDDSITVTDQAHVNTARTPSSSSTMGDSVYSALCELSSQLDRDVALVSGSTSVQSTVEST